MLIVFGQDAEHGHALRREAPASLPYLFNELL
jgi:hypothetical protein